MQNLAQGGMRVDDVAQTVEGGPEVHEYGYFLRDEGGVLAIKMAAQEGALLVGEKLDHPFGGVAGMGFAIGAVIAFVAAIGG